MLECNIRHGTKSCWPDPLWVCNLTKRRQIIPLSDSDHVDKAKSWSLPQSLPQLSWKQTHNFNSFCSSQTDLQTDLKVTHSRTHSPFCQSQEQLLSVPPPPVHTASLKSTLESFTTTTLLKPEINTVNKTGVLKQKREPKRIWKERRGVCGSPVTSGASSSSSSVCCLLSPTIPICGITLNPLVNIMAPKRPLTSTLTSFATEFFMLLTTPFKEIVP